LPAPDPQAGFKGPTSKGREGEGGGKGRDGRGGDGRGGPLLSVCCSLAKKARFATGNYFPKLHDVRQLNRRENRF